MLLGLQDSEIDINVLPRVIVDKLLGFICFLQQLIFKVIIMPTFLISINIAVQSNNLLLSDSYRSLQSDIYFITKLH